MIFKAAAASPQPSQNTRTSSPLFTANIDVEVSVLFTGDIACFHQASEKVAIRIIIKKRSRNFFFILFYILADWKASVGPP